MRVLQYKYNIFQQEENDFPSVEGEKICMEKPDNGYDQMNSNDSGNSDI